MNSYIIRESVVSLIPYLLILDSNLPQSMNITVNVSTIPGSASGTIRIFTNKNQPLKNKLVFANFVFQDYSDIRNLILIKKINSTQEELILFPWSRR